MFKHIKGITRKLWDIIRAIYNKIYVYKKHIIVTSLIPVCALIYSEIGKPLLSKYIDINSTKIFSTKKLSYEISSISRHKKYELSEIEKAEKLDTFELTLDDNIIDQYYLVKIYIKNHGDSIENPLKFKIYFGNNQVKIIDIKHKIIKPSNKYFSVIHNLPRLTWNMDGYNSFDVIWDDSAPEAVAGYHIYRSLHEQVGYVRINDEMVTQQEFSIPIVPSKELAVAYYRVAHAGHFGGESSLSEPIRTPDQFAFQPFFKGVYWIDPDNPSEKKADGSVESPFYTLSEAMASVGKAATFILMQKKNQVTSSQNLSNEVTVYYKDDLDFLNGIAEVSMPKGIDEDSTIQLLFLCKLRHEKQIDVKIDLQESLNIRFSKSSNRVSNNVYKKQDTKIDDQEKSLLTPLKIRMYTGENTIFLAWDKPKSPKYKGVRIFRSSKAEATEPSSIGEELYDGAGYTHVLHCTYRASEQQRPSLQKGIADEEIPPPRKSKLGELARQAGPTNLRMIPVDVFPDDNSSYYADTSVSPGIAYIYTVWAYDDNDKYGYSITINASVNDVSSKNICNQVDSVDSQKTAP